MKPSKNFFDLVKAFEGCKLSAYKDIAGIWTIGYGTIMYPNGDHVKEGDICIQQEADIYLLDHIKNIKLLPFFNQQQFDSCLDFNYNNGNGAWLSSSLRKDIIANKDENTITKDFCMWDKAHVDGELVEIDGLLRRRKCEAYLYFNGKNHPTFFE